MQLFEQCKGLVVGDFTNIKSNNPQWGSSIESLILDVVKDYDFPVFFGFDAGHEIKNQALILGANISIETLGDSGVKNKPLEWPVITLLTDWEQRAIQFLKDLRYTVLETNYR